jgi:hypothetical protein
MMYVNLHMRGATAHEGQVGRVCWRIPFRRFGGLRKMKIYLEPED